MSHLGNLHALEELDLNDNDLCQLCKLPDSIIELDISNNYVNIIRDLPIGLITFKSSNCFTLSISSFPTNLVHIDIHGNTINTLPALPECLEYLDCSYNDLEHIPELPVGLKTLICHGNDIKVSPPRENIIYYIVDVSYFTNIPSVYVPSLKELCMRACLYDDICVIPDLEDYMGTFRLCDYCGYNETPNIEFLGQRSYLRSGLTIIRARKSVWCGCYSRCRIKNARVIKRHIRLK